MRHALLTTAVLLCTSTTWAQTRPVTVDDVLSMKAVASAVISPDGSAVIHTVRQWEAENDRMESRTHIWKVAVAGGPARQITFGERGESQPQWSPDGRYISFIAARGDGAGDDPPRPQIYFMPSDGGEASKLTDAKEGVFSYAWAPNSTRIAYELFRGMKGRGRPTELVFYPREGHGITEYYHQKDRLTRIMDWVTRYTLGSGKTTTRQ